MAGLKVFKELELPQLDEIQLNSIYLIGNSNSSHVDIYIQAQSIIDKEYYKMCCRA